MLTSNLEITYNINGNKVEEIKELFDNEFWTNDRKIDDIREMIKNTSLLIGVIDKNNNDKLIGFARVLTDFTYVALITDVMSHKDYRNKGVGKLIMDAFLNAKQLQSVKQLELYCKDKMVAFYEKWGLEKSEVLNFMRLKR